ncbi:hypothetical protein AB9K26_13180 [Psychroserpens sp. XS_ASV72]|uniref:hypothetical protein n=1 Tax=Psychroserpens sp. XS_ASV72 TaxID=3241293 RepID=UPI0035184575
MKTILYIMCFAFSQHMLAQTIIFDRTLETSTSEVRPEIKADTSGGTATFKRVYNDRCIGHYNIRWSFSKDLNVLRDGEQFQVTINCTNCDTPCGFKWKIANAHAAGLSETLIPGYIYNKNIDLLSTTAGASGVHDWSPGHTTHTYTFIYKKKKTAPIASFMLDFAGYQLHYVFRSGGDTFSENPNTTSPNLNCNWSSTFGNINWQDGWYGNTSKTLSGTISFENGRYVYKGVWGRTNSSSSGQVVFLFSQDNRSFTGYYTRGNATRQYQWSGQLNCQ